MLAVLVQIPTIFRCQTFIHFQRIGKYPLNMVLAKSSLRGARFRKIANTISKMVRRASMALPAIYAQVVLLGTTASLANATDVLKTKYCFV
jgi:hypothetical protein